MSAYYRPLVACWLLEQLAARPGVTQAEVARAIGVSQQRISEWLRGRKRPRERNCIRLAQFFGADPTTVMALAGHQVNVPLVAAEATASTFGPPSLPTGGASPASAQGPRSIREEAAQWLARLPVAIPIYERNLGQEPPGPPADYAYWDPAKAAGRHIWGIRVLEHPLEPEIRVGDTLFIDVDRPPVHGDLVASLRGRPGVPPALPATARRDSLSG